MSIPAELKYARSHEWVRSEADGTVTVGISFHAQEQLGDMVFVELPVAGRQLARGEECAVVESVKAASDVYAPVAGKVMDVNGELEGAPEQINTDPYGAWMFRLQPDSVAELDALLDAAAYAALVDSESH